MFMRRLKKIRILIFDRGMMSMIIRKLRQLPKVKAKKSRKKIKKRKLIANKKWLRKLRKNNHKQYLKHET